MSLSKVINKEYKIVDLIIRREFESGFLSGIAEYKKQKKNDNAIMEWEHNVIGSQNISGNIPSFRYGIQTRLVSRKKRRHK